MQLPTTHHSRRRASRIVTLVAALLCLLGVAARVSADGAHPLALTEQELRWIEAHPEVSVTNEFDWPPFDFLVAGQSTGFGIDLMNILSQRSGIRFKYINGYTWDELVQMFFRWQNRRHPFAEPDPGASCKGPVFLPVFSQQKCPHLPQRYRFDQRPP